MFQIERVNSQFEEETFSYLSNINKEIIKLNDEIKAAKISLNSFYNKAIVRSFFESSNNDYFITDYKTNKVLTLANKCEVKNGQIENKVINKNEVDIVSIVVDKAKSTLTDQFKAIDIDEDTSLIHRKGYVWNYIIGLKEFNDDGQVNPHTSGKLTLNVNLDGFNYVNHIYIESGSSLPIEFEEANIRYWNGTSWSTLSDVKEIKLFNRKFISFNTIYTSKLELIFNQSSYIDVSKIKEGELDSDGLKEFINRSYLDSFNQESKAQFKRIYDLSLKELKVVYKQYNNLGYYRDGKHVSVNNMLSCGLDIIESSNFSSNYIEKYLKVELFKESNTTNISGRDLVVEKEELIIPIPNDGYEETELLVFKRDIAKINFYPEMLSLSDIRVYKDGALLSIDDDYRLSFDGGVSYRRSIPVSYSSETEMFFVKVLNRELGSEYKIKYKLHRKIKVSPEISIEDGKVLFAKEVSGFVKAIIIIRNANDDNLSSSIKEFSYLIEENLEKDTVRINSKTKSLSKRNRGTLNVI